MPTRGLLLFCLTATLAALAVAAFGWRSVVQERRLAGLELQERLDLAAEATARKLDATVQDWTWRLDPERVQRESSELPAALRPGVSEPGAWVLLWDQAGAVASWPHEQLLYQVGGTAEWSELPPQDDVALRSAHTKARSMRTAGDLPGALAAFQELGQRSGTLAGLPVTMVAQYELCDTLSTIRNRTQLLDCATDFYRALVTSRWSLPAERYFFYEAQALAWREQVGGRAADLAAFDVLAARKRGLSAAARAFASYRCEGERPMAASGMRMLPPAVVITWCRPTDGAPQPTALVVDASWFTGQLWPRLSTEVSGAFHLALSRPDGLAIWATSAGAGASTAPDHTGSAMVGDFRLYVWDKDDRASHRSLARQRWSLAAVALTLVSLLVAAGSTGWALRRQLQTAQMKADFVTTVTHELQTPVTAVRQMAELLVRGRVPEARRREYYERITSEAERLGRLIAQILDMARGDTGQMAYHFERLDAAEWLRASVSAFSERQAVTEAHVTTSLPASLPAIHADRAAITSALHNLLDNAVKYSGGRAVVVVTARDDGASVIIEVTDEGIGMTSEELRLAFERFYRGHRHVTSGPAGTGIGLSLVRQIVKAHGGSVDVSSRLGHGATFTMRLPAGPARA